jgi:hypothetical protein
LEESQSIEISKRPSSTRKEEDDDIYLDPNYISFEVSSIDEFAKNIITSPGGSIHTKSGLTSMLNELEKTMIHPKMTLQYVKSKELIEKTRKLFNSGTSSVPRDALHRDGTRKLSKQGAGSVPLECDGLFVALNDGDPYHSLFKNEIYRKNQGVPVLIVEGASGVGAKEKKRISIHIEIARKNPFQDLEEAIQDLSKYCAHPTCIPIVTKIGYSSVRLPGIESGKRVKLPIFQTKISKDSSNSTKLSQMSGDFVRQAFQIPQNMNSTIQNDDPPLLKSRYADAIKAKKEFLLLPKGMGLDEFYRALHHESSGFDPLNSTWDWQEGGTVGSRVSMDQETILVDEIEEDDLE